MAFKVLLDEFLELVCEVTKVGRLLLNHSILI
jgi:hypothetical protein